MGDRHISVAALFAILGGTENVLTLFPVISFIDSQTKAVADAAKDSAETSKAAAETSKDLLNKTTAAAQQAAASAASASYALGPDESGRLSFFIKKST